MKLKRMVLPLLITLTLANLPSAAAEGREAIPAPASASPEMRALIEADPAPYWNAKPKNAAEWKAFVDGFAREVTPLLPALRELMQVSSEPGVMAGVPVFTLTPAKAAPEAEGRVLLNFHGGGYVLGPGESGSYEGILMSGISGFKVIAVDYRMAPEFPYPAALDDALAVYRELLKTVPAEKIGVFGTSTGGGMTLALVLRAKAEGLPLPGAIAPGTPWTDLTKTGDTYFTNENLDNVLVGYDGWLAEAARVYAAGHDMKDPLLSPVYGDVTGFPPALLSSGTRDLFLSNTVRMHLKLREAGAEADLLVYEGQSHAQYLMSPEAPETRFHFTELGKFFKRHLR